jgi:hypothetical protein
LAGAAQQAHLEIRVEAAITLFLALLLAPAVALAAVETQVLPV